MKISVGRLRALLLEAKVEKISASKGYMKKERVRERLQGVIAGMVASGEIKDDAELQDAFAAASMALSALKMIPLQVWQKMPT
jgi:hypothetical protein